MNSKNISPDYNLIFKDIIAQKHPEKQKEYSSILSKTKLSALEIIEINGKLFGSPKKEEQMSQKHRSYSKSDILQILDYQKKHRLNNSQLANHFKLSRNTVAKWKKLFLID